MNKVFGPNEFVNSVCDRNIIKFKTLSFKNSSFNEYLCKKY